MRNNGFTTIELLAVLAIILTIVGIGIPAYNSWRNRGKTARAKAVIQQIEMALEMYKTDNGGYPDWWGELNNPATPSEWKITNCLKDYMRFEVKDLMGGVLYDPWGHYYVVLVDNDGDPATPGFPNFRHNKNSSYIYSYGPDEKESHSSYEHPDNADNIDNYRR